MVFAPVSSSAQNETIAGPAYSEFRLTLESGSRQEAVGPLFYSQETDSERQWALPPLFSRTVTLGVDWSETDFLYPIFTWRRFGSEYRGQFLQLLSVSGGKNQSNSDSGLLTVFPFYFQRRSSDPASNYTAFFPFYGHLENRLFRDDIKFALFPLYSETRKKDVVTDNYLYPFFDTRHGDQLSGWQFWPLFGTEQKGPTFSTNNLGEVETLGGYDRQFVIWPFFLQDHSGIGTTNESRRVAVIPFYNQLRSPVRDETFYGWPFGYWIVEDREKKYSERDFLWPLVVTASGSKTETRVFPFYSHAAAGGLESDFYLWPLYKVNRLEAAPLERERDRVLFFLYSDTREKNTRTGDSKRRVDFWPFYTYQRDMDHKESLQALSLLEPFLPDNRSIARDYSPLWSLWRSEKNPKTGAASQSLLWNLYRHESGPQTKKYSLLFGLFQYQSTAGGSSWRVFYVPLGKKAAQNAVKQ